MFENRGVNAAQGGYSAQPAFGGPVYFFRNVLYHVPTGVAFKFSAKPAGLLVFHNTLIGEQSARDPSSNLHYRNNLFLGRDAPDRGVMTWAHSADTGSSDYNGYRPNRGVTTQYAWFSPPPGQRVYAPAREQWRTFATLGELRAATGQERHGVELDFDTFLRMSPPDPSRRHAVYHAMDLDFRLRPGGKAVDAGIEIPTVNDGFAGTAPDLGAPAPRYGPRWLDWQPFYR